MRFPLWAGAMALALMSCSASAQIKDRFGRAIEPSASAIVDKNGNPIDGTNPLPVAGKQESAVLVSANTPSAAVTLYGGSYVLSQLCATYGSVALRYRAADGGTMTTLVTKIAPDAVATVVQFGSGAMVDATVSGATGCNVTLSRIP